MKQTLARLITYVFNPFLMGFVIIVLLVFEGTDTTADALKWAGISLALSVLPVLALVIYLVRRKKLDGIFENPRRQRIGIYALAVALGVLGWWLLRYLNAPEELEATFAAGAAAVLIIVYGAPAAWMVFLIPAVIWARIELKQHTPAQAGVGAILAAVLVVLIFWGYGMVR